MKELEKIKYYCEECESEFVIWYNEEKVADAPQYCVICCAYLIKEDAIEDEEIEED